MAQMVFAYGNKPTVLCKYQTDVPSFPKRDILREGQNVDLKNRKGSIDRIRETFGKVEISVSSYDTAWVAMVPSRVLPNQPCFPQCLDWVMENQHRDGSWGLNPSHPLLLKDSLSSTLACVLALQKWRVGEQLVQKGLDFIATNRLAMNDQHQPSPIGFDIVFPGMISHAKELGLNLPLDSALVNLMLSNRDLQIESFRGNKKHLAYVAEGLGASYDWKEAMIHQRSNGSLFNSPATTAASLIQLHDHRSFNYLQSLLNIFGNAVPTIYPFEIYARLCIVDELEKLGIDRYFRYEIQSVLDETYRCWQQKHEEIFLDPTCFAMAFRLLRMNGYEIASEALAEFVDEENFFNTVSLQFSHTSAVFELYKAAQITIYQKEPILEKIHEWTSTFLKQKLLNEAIQEERLKKEVEYALEYSINSLDRLENRRSIELYHADNFRMLKTSYRCSSNYNSDFLTFSLHDFNNCQAIHREELQELEKWVKVWRLDGLKFEWHTLVCAYFQYAAVHFSPELSDARILWSKNCVIGTILDDMFDMDGSKEEFLNIIELVEKWDGYSAVGYCSKRIELLFLSLYDTVNDYAAKAFTNQGRCIKHHLIEIWLDLLKCMLKHFEWWTNNTTPTLDEYISDGATSFGYGLYAMSFYLLGPEFSVEVLNSEEYTSIYMQAGAIGRLLNDYSSDEREKTERKLNGCSIIRSQCQEAITEEEARTETRRLVENFRREVLRMMLQKKPCLVPKEFKESLWKSSKICHWLYTSGDKNRCQSNTFDDIKAVIYDPLGIPYIQA